mmetsp:Transcript_16629/g.38192  ORF Transcript_16629/g.38192 Transcript_16629/m.38192 type:complete len:313 (+) Transcript_16629:108-1046(+)
MRVVACILLFVLAANAFSGLPQGSRFQTRKISQKAAITHSRFSPQLSANQNNEGKYGLDVVLREEAESPFRKVRFFVYFGLGGGALTSLFVSFGRILAGLSGINTDLLQESEINAAVDIAGIVLIAFLWKRDVEAQESRLKRVSKGAEIAKLLIRAPKKLANDDVTGGMFTTELSSLRRGRGIEKRVIIAAGGKEKIEQIMKDAERLNDPLMENDLVVVPIVLPRAEAPTIDGTPESLPDCLALPVGFNWRNLLDDESREAAKQGIDAETDGFAIVLKKNGRVGQRTKGVNLGKFVGEVINRKESGLDVTNI